MESGKGSVEASSAVRSVFTINFAVLGLSTVLAAGAAAFFLIMIRPLLFLRADLLMWEETDFVGNIIKLNIGAPLYTDPADGNSLIYNPGAFLLTYAIAWIAGQTRSVEALRLIQLGYVVIAALFATLSCQQLRRQAFPGQKVEYPAIWAIFTFLAMFLAATAPYSNKFVYSLHVDAMALMIVAAAMWLALRYSDKQSPGTLFALCLFPALGFFTKQFLVSLVPVIFVFLLIIHPKKLKRLAIFLVFSSSLVVATYGLCYLIWGDNYLFWTVEVMGGIRKQVVFSPDAYSISISRGIDHLARVWLELLVGVIGAWWLIRFGISRAAVALSAAWLVLIASEAFSSGAGWETLYHFGPAVLTGAVLMFSALPDVWTKVIGSPELSQPFGRKFASGFLMLSAVAGIFFAWRVVPTGDRREARYLRAIEASPDLDRYVAEIESEFNGLEPERVLLGIGNWNYLQHDILQKDRAVSLGDQPLAGNYENFDVTVKRIRSHTYEKILVHDFHSPYFLYDWATWDRPSGFRAALLENYTEVRTIPQVQGNILYAAPHVYSGPVSVFVPRK